MRLRNSFFDALPLLLCGRPATEWNLLRHVVRRKRTAAQGAQVFGENLGSARSSPRTCNVFAQPIVRQTDDGHLHHFGVSGDHVFDFLGLIRFPPHLIMSRSRSTM